MRSPLPHHELKWLKQAAVQSNRSYEHLLQRRLAREPLQYIIGTQPFGPLNLLTRPPTLIPRPETEEWSIRLSEHISPSPDRPLSLLDLGTGTGCIPLLLCHLWPKGSIFATGIDISPRAIQLARDNAALCGITQVAFRTSDFLAPGFPNSESISPPYDILTSNPPYISSSSEYLQLSDEVAKFEDPTALLGGHDGLTFYRAIARLIAGAGFLSPNALVALEVGHNQADAVCAMVQASGFSTIVVWKDLWSKNRTVVARR